MRDLLWILGAVILLLGLVVQILDRARIAGEDANVVRVLRGEPLSSEAPAVASEADRD